MTHEHGLTRRRMLRAAIGGAAGFLVGAPVRSFAGSPTQPAPERGDPLRLDDDLFVVSVPGQANVVARTDRDGVLLVDGGSVGASDALMNIVSGLPGSGPVHTIFNTHWHVEQTGSNERLGNAGADDHRAREHTAVADDRRHLALERAAVRTPADDRATEQDVLRHRRARFGRSLRVHSRCGAYRRRSVRAFSEAERACGRRRGVR